MKSLQSRFSANVPSSVTSLYRPLVRQFTRLPAYAALALIRAYQLTLSYFFGRQCRFTPSCSAYTAAAIRYHGLLRGGGLGFRRICRCGPNSPGGYDPVPEQESNNERCDTMIDILCSVSRPFIIFLEQGYDSQDIQHRYNKLSVFILDGESMITWKDFFSHVGKVMNFPDYYGHNSAALIECMTDTDVIPARPTFVLIDKCDSLLSAEKSGEQKDAFRIFERICEDWAEPVNLGEYWDRPEIPFHFGCIGNHS